MTKGFAGLHPVVNFTYFVLVIAFSMVFMHPVCLCISFFCAIVHLFSLTGKKAFKNLYISVFVIITTMIINPLFSHEGVTILTYFPNGNPLTAESVIYGFGAGTMLACVILHFSCYNTVVTSDKFIYLFGKAIPSMSLIISMTLNFVPKFIRRINSVAATQKCIGKGAEDKKITDKIKCGLNILSITTTYALESSIDISLSMKARGYGLPQRTTYSNFRFDKRDTAILIIILIAGTYTIYGFCTNKIAFQYYPIIKGIYFNPLSLSVYMSYFLLCIIPVLINIKEALTWKFLKSKN